MSLYLSKVLALFVLPLGWALLLGFWALLLVAAGRKRLATWVVALQLVLLWVCSSPWFAYVLTARLERAYPPVAIERTPAADVVVILGGAVGPVGEQKSENLTSSSDRVLRAARLYRARKVGHVLAVGGNLPWLEGAVPEAEAMRDLLVEWGVPRDAVLTETESRNTRENALLASEIIRAEGWGRVLLITSASHMARAVGVFRSAGLDVIPSPTDFGVLGPISLDFLDFLPDADALWKTSAALREVIAVSVYRWRGWLE